MSRKYIRDRDDSKVNLIVGWTELRGQKNVLDIVLLV